MYPLYHSSYSCITLPHTLVNPYHTSHTLLISLVGIAHLLLVSLFMHQSLLASLLTYQSLLASLLTHHSPSYHTSHIVYASSHSPLTFTPLNTPYINLLLIVPTLLPSRHLPSPCTCCLSVSLLTFCPLSLPVSLLPVSLTLHHPHQAQLPSLIQHSFSVPCILIIHLHPPTLYSL